MSLFSHVVYRHPRAYAFALMLAISAYALIYGDPISITE